MGQGRNERRTLLTESFHLELSSPISLASSLDSSKEDGAAKIYSNNCLVILSASRSFHFKGFKVLIHHSEHFAFAISGNLASLAVS